MTSIFREPTSAKYTQNHRTAKDTRPANLKRTTALDQMARVINEAPSPIMDGMLAACVAEIRATEAALGLPAATLP